MFKSGNGGSMDGIPALGANLAVVTSPTGVLTTSITTSLELSYLSGVTSNVQTQIDGLQTQINGKQPTGNYITALSGDVVANGPGSATATIQPGVVTNAMLAGSIAQNKMLAVTASRALVSDASGFYTASVTTSLELSYLSGVTSNVQTQIDGKMTNPMTTGGDVIYGGASGVPTRLANGTSGQFLKSNGTTVAPSWANATAPTVQYFTSGSGLTYTKPTGVTYIRVRMVGGGGGSSGSGSPGTSGAGGTGSSTTFGSSLLTANGGGGGQVSAGSYVGGSGGSGTINSPAVRVLIVIGGSGGAPGGSYAGGLPGGSGGNSYLGGGAGGAPSGAAATLGASGTGGGGGGSGSTGATIGGSGGGAGGYVEAIISNPDATYSYTVGSSGAGGTAGTSGAAGGQGGYGVIVVEEYYD